MKIDIKQDEDGFHTQIEICLDERKLSLEHIITDSEYTVKLNNKKVEDRVFYAKIIRSIGRAYDKLLKEIDRLPDEEENQEAD